MTRAEWIRHNKVRLPPAERCSKRAKQDLNLLVGALACLFLGVSKALSGVSCDWVSEREESRVCFSWNVDASFVDGIRQ